MNDNLKLPTGIVIGLVAASAIWFFATKDDKIPSTQTPLTVDSTVTTNTTTPNTPPVSSANTPAASGEEKVSGKFGIDHYGLYGEYLCFQTTTTSKTFAKGTYFCFSNNEQATTALKVNSAGKIGYPGCDNISGNADITISEFTKPTTGGDAPNTAKLVTVNKITSAATCGKGTLTY